MIKCRKCGRMVDRAVRLKVETVETTSLLTDGDEREIWRERIVDDSVYCENCLGVPIKDVMRLGKKN